MSAVLNVDAPMIPRGDAGGQSLPRVVVGHMYHVCYICSATLNAVRPFCFLTTGDEARSSHRHCDACADLLASDPGAYGELRRAREQHLNDATAHELLSAHWPVLPTLPDPATPDPQLLPRRAARRPKPAEIAIVPTELATLRHRYTANMIRAYLAYARHGAQADAADCSPWTICQETGMRSLTLRRAMQALEAHGYAAQVTRAGRVLWRLYVTPERREGVQS
jgi:hypothetical protein